MRHLRNSLAALLLVLTLATVAQAATAASSVNSFATVSPDGGCQVSMTLTLHLEQPVEKLYFPIPRDASAVAVNGSRVTASRSGEVRRINLSRYADNVVGDITVNIQYSLHDVIVITEEDTQQLQLPLLSGFEYPVESLSFSVTLPGENTALPAFTSGYHQAGIEEHLTYTVEGATVSGVTLQAMKDHETLTMLLSVTEEMFPRSIVEKQSVGTMSLAMGICAAVAFLYWLLMLRHIPWRYQQCSQPPQGFNAGVLGCVKAMKGVDLTSLVMGWAQLGYLLIRVDRKGKVLLEKRMDMGNECSEFEQRCFKKLFGKRQLVDTTGYAYASLHRQLSQRPALVAELMHRHTGNNTAFRVIASGIGLFGGAGMGLALGSGAALQGVLVVLLGAAGGYSGWLIQLWSSGVGLRGKDKLYTGLALAGLWLLLGALAGEFVFGAWMVSGLLAAGLLLGWAGRRTEQGRQVQAQLQGLGHYFRTADKQQLRQLLDTDPEHFFRLAPYAMALGSLQTFAKRFGGVKLSDCPYLTLGAGGNMTALQWAKAMEQTAAAMEDRAKKLPLEKLLGMLHSVTRR